MHLHHTVTDCITQSISILLFSLPLKTLHTLNTSYIENAELFRHKIVFEIVFTKPVYILLLIFLIPLSTMCLHLLLYLLPLLIYYYYSYLNTLLHSINTSYHYSTTISYLKHASPISRVYLTTPNVLILTLNT